MVRHEIHRPKEITPQSHIITTRLPGLHNPDFITTITDQHELRAKSSDEAKYPGGHTPEVVRLSKDAGEAEIAKVLSRSTTVLPIGAQSSLTGGATPEGAVVLDFSHQDRILEIGKDIVTVQPGITLHALQEKLAEENKYFPPVPTSDGATVAGTIATNAAGAATFKYGQTRAWVEALTVVLASGEILDIKRGKHFAHPDGYFQLHKTSGIRRIPIPTYTMPNVPKLSAGYFAGPEMDEIDLFIGSEGTLGVIAQATLRVIPKPQLTWGLVACENEEQALLLTSKLRNEAVNAWDTQGKTGIDVSAIEYMDAASVALLREDSKERQQLTPPDDANTLLLVQMESLEENSLNNFITLLDGIDPQLLENTQLANTCDQQQIEYFKGLREAVPEGINRRIAQVKQSDPRISKMAGDMIVPFINLPNMLHLFRQKFEEAGLDYAIWGHISDGNMHPNVLPQTFEELEIAKQIIFDCGREVIQMGGSPLAEHGVGRNPIKQDFLRVLYGNEGIEQMRQVKQALDPKWKLAPGNLFAKV